VSALEPLEALGELYREVDELFSGTSCPGTTECCRFGRTRREPYVTSVETALILRALARQGGVPRPAAVPLRGGPFALPVVNDERACPLLSAQGRCSAYASRPLGCRTFFCDRASADRPIRHREVLGLVRRLQELALRHRPCGDEGRPLTRALSQELALNKARPRPSNPSR